MKQIKLLCLFLSFVLVFAFLSNYSVSAVFETSQPPQIIEATKVKEIKAYREVNSQTFLMSNGKFQCIIYAEDKFCKTSDGKLVEIENAIVPTTHIRGGVDYEYKNKAGKSDVYFSNGTGDVFISAEKGTLRFVPKIARGDAKTVVGTQYKHKSADFIIEGDDVIAYTDVYTNTDIVFQVTNNGIKEYTVLKAKPETNGITYVFDHEGLKIVQNKKTVSFTDLNGNEVFSLGTLFALDNAGNYTEKLTYTIAPIEKYKSEITVSLDNAYLKNAVFPVVIDPSVMITGQSNIYDTFTSSANPNTNYYLNTNLRTGRDTPFGIRRTYIKFNLPTTLDGITVDSASLNIRMRSGVAPTRVFVHPVANNWSSSTITWNNAPTYHSSPSTSLSTDQNNWYKAAHIFKNIVQDWIDGDKQNYGVMLFDSNESDASHWTTFYSAEASSPNKPELVIEYTPAVIPPIDPEDSYTVIWNTYYDFSYPIYYGQTLNQAISSISSYTTAVKNRLEELIPPLTVVTVSPIYHLTPMDFCKEIVLGSSTVDDVVGHCNCPTGQRDNCEEQYNVRDHFAQAAPAAIYHSNILWTCNTVYTYALDKDGQRISDPNDPNGTNCKTYTNRSSSNSSLRTVLLLKRLNNNRVVESQNVLFHEICHQYGAPDHYHDPDSVNADGECKNHDFGCSECNDKNPRDANCIMNNSWGADINSDTVLCDRCHANVWSWLVINANDNFYG